MNRVVWRENQIQALIAAGLDPLDAERTVDLLLRHMPDGVDPEQWMPTFDVLRLLDDESAEALQDARADWYAVVPAKWSRILEAQEKPDGESKVIPIGLVGFFWNAQTKRYETTNPARAVADKHLRGLVNERVDELEEYAGNLGAGRMEGRIAPAIWMGALYVALRRWHLQARALGVGGWARMGAADLAAVSERLGLDRGRIERMGRDLAAGSVSVAQLMNRMRGYVGGGLAEYWDGLRGLGPSAPGRVVMEIRYLRPAEHCSDCVRYYGQGWQVSGVLPAPATDSECGNFCRCYMVRREVWADQVNEWLGTRRA